eukprot:gene18798-biopygen6944
MMIIVLIICIFRGGGGGPPPAACCKKAVFCTGQELIRGPIGSPIERCPLCRQRRVYFYDPTMTSHIVVTSSTVVSTKHSARNIVAWTFNVHTLSGPLPMTMWIVVLGLGAPIATWCHRQIWQGKLLPRTVISWVGQKTVPLWSQQQYLKGNRGRMMNWGSSS